MGKVVVDSLMGIFLLPFLYLVAFSKRKRGKVTHGEERAFSERKGKSSAV